MAKLDDPFLTELRTLMANPQAKTARKDIEAARYDARLHRKAEFLEEKIAELGEEGELFVYENPMSASRKTRNALTLDLLRPIATGTVIPTRDQIDMIPLDYGIQGEEKRQEFRDRGYAYITRRQTAEETVTITNTPAIVIHHHAGSHTAPTDSKNPLHAILKEIMGNCVCESSPPRRVFRRTGIPRGISVKDLAVGFLKTNRRIDGAQESLLKGDYPKEENAAKAVSVATWYSALTRLMAENVLPANDDEKKRAHDAFKQWLIDHQTPAEIIAQYYTDEPSEAASTEATTSLQAEEPAAGSWSAEAMSGAVSPIAVKESRRTTRSKNT